MSADRFEITDTNGLRIDGIPWRERGLLVQYAAIRQQARDIAELRAKLETADYWRDVYPEGMTAEQVANELADYKMILENVSLVYCHVTGGRISKGNTLASAVIGEADAIMDSAIGEAVHEERQLTMQAESERDQLRADLAAAVAARANMETDLELAHFAAMKESEWKPRAETADTTGRLAA